MSQLLYLAFGNNPQHCMYKCNPIKMTLTFITNNSTMYSNTSGADVSANHPCYDIWMQEMVFAWEQRDKELWTPVVGEADTFLGQSRFNTRENQPWMLIGIKHHEI